MLTRVLLIRHGETKWSKEDRFCGVSDILLSAKGREQVELLARQLAQMPISAVYSSPLQRNLETAQIIARQQGLAAETVPDLRELDYGLWEGLTREEIQKQFNSEFEAWAQDPATQCPPQGETGIALVERVLPVVQKIVAAHAGETIAIVGHKAVNRLLICSLLGIPLKAYRQRIKQSVACLNVLEFSSVSEVCLALLNDTSHYRGGYI